MGRNGNLRGIGKENGTYGKGRGERKRGEDEMKEEERKEEEKQCGCDDVFDDGTTVLQVAADAS